ncbi:MAG: hypothetical protein HC892_22855 [Saprospiraceae bacterium]|nr:hypothetical protein [Saprospiraceae bacterium]
MIRPFARFGLLAFCKKIYVSGAENIKTDRPVILASNHPTAFLEPCILACFYQPQSILWCVLIFLAHLSTLN